MFRRRDSWEDLNTLSARKKTLERTTAYHVRKQDAGSVIINSSFMFADLHAVQHNPFIDPDGKPTGRIDTRPHLVFKRRTARSKVRKWHHETATAFLTPGKIHACRLLCTKFSLPPFFLSMPGKRQA